MIAQHNYQLYVLDCKKRNVKPMSFDCWLDFLCAGMGY